MNENEWVFLSYNNRNAQEALTIAQKLLADGYPLWVDRFQIAPDADWDASLFTMQNQSVKAIVLLSHAYLSSEYCLQELAQLAKNQAKIIAVCLEPGALKDAEESNFFARMDYNPDKEATVGDIRSKLDELDCFAAPISNENHYLYQVICQLELDLLASPTARIAALNQNGTEAEERKLRPRCHAPQLWLNHGHYDLYEAEANLAHANHLVLDNILEWFAWRSRMMIIGESGTGKSSLLRYLCLISAFRRLKEGVELPLPYYCELGHWTGKQSLSQYIRQGWPLDSDIEQLLPRGAVMLFVDGLGEDNELEKRAGKEIESLLDKNKFPAIVIAAREENLNIDFPTDLAFVQIKTLDEKQFELLAKSLLGKASLANKPQKLESLIIELLMQTIALDNNFSSWEQNCAYIVPALWQQLNPQSNNRFTSSDLLNALETFAFSTLEMGTSSSVYPYSVALAAMGNDLLLQLALNLGILKQQGQGFRFVINSLPIYLAAQRLLNDGIYQHLRHPRFDNKGERIPQAWDSAIFFAARLLSAENLELYIQTIADIDPYLAFSLAQAQENLSSASLRDIISKLLESSSGHLRSMSLSIRCMNSVANKELVLNVLVEALQNGTEARRNKALEFLRALELPFEQEFLSALGAIELDFPDSVYGVLDSLDSLHLLTQLSRLLLLGDESQRLRAIYALGEYAHPLGGFVISQLQTHEKPEILRTAINALCKIGSKDAAGFFYQLLLHPEAEIIQNASESLRAVDTSTKSRLSIFLATERLLNQPLLDTLLACSEQQVSRILAYTLGNLGYGLSHSIDLERLSDGSSEMVKRLLDLLSSRMASLNSSEAFQDFADKTLNQMDKEQAEGLRREKGVSALAQRVRPTKAESKQESSLNGQTIPAALLEALQHPDWLLRLNAVEEIGRYAPELSLKHLMVAAGDSDSQVRMAALNTMPSAREHQQVLAALLKALDDDDTQVIDAVAERLRKSGEIAISELVAKLQGSKDYSLAVIIDLLGELGDETAVASLASFIDDVREPWMWNHCIGDIAVQALISIGSPEALQIVKESGRLAYPVFNDIILPGSDDEFGREGSHLDLFVALLSDLRSDNWQQSQEAARKMRAIAQELKEENNESLASNLLEFLDDSNWLVRWTLVESLAWLHASCAIPALLESLADENWMVQIASIRALVELKARESSRNIASLLLSQNNTVREAAAEALGELGNPDSVQALTLALGDADQFVRLAVVRAIILINDGSQADSLLDALNDDYNHVRWYAIRAIAQAANPKHVRAVVPLLRDKSKPDWEKYSISNYAELALQRMASPASKKVLAKWEQVKHLHK